MIRYRFEFAGTDDHHWTRWNAEPTGQSSTWFSSILGARMGLGGMPELDHCLLCDYVRTDGGVLVPGLRPRIVLCAAGLVLRGGAGSGDGRGSGLLTDSGNQPAAQFVEAPFLLCLLGHGDLERGEKPFLYRLHVGLVGHRSKDSRGDASAVPPRRSLSRRRG